MAVYGELTATDSFNTEALFKSAGEFIGVFAGAFAIGGLFGISTAFVSLFIRLYYRSHPKIRFF